MEPDVVDEPETAAGAATGGTGRGKVGPSAMPDSTFAEAATATATAALFASPSSASGVSEGGGRSGVPGSMEGAGMRAGSGNSGADDEEEAAAEEDAEEGEGDGRGAGPCGGSGAGAGMWPPTLGAPAAPPASGVGALVTGLPRTTARMDPMGLPWVLNTLPSDATHAPGGRFTPAGVGMRVGWPPAAPTTVPAAPAPATPLACPGSIGGRGPAEGAGPAAAGPADGDRLGRLVCAGNGADDAGGDSIKPNRL